MIIEFDGENLVRESDFHVAFAEALDITEYYGGNLSALWDVLSTDVERPVTIIWNNSAASKKTMGERFERVVEILQKVEQHDKDAGYKNRFEIILR